MIARLIPGPDCRAFANAALTRAFTYELCAGISDKPDLALAELAALEVYEETGYRVAADQLQLLSSHVSSAGGEVGGRGSVGGGARDLGRDL